MTIREYIHFLTASPVSLDAEMIGFSINDTTSSPDGCDHRPILNGVYFPVVTNASLPTKDVPDEFHRRGLSEDDIAKTLEDRACMKCNPSQT